MLLFSRAMQDAVVFLREDRMAVAPALTYFTLVSLIAGKTSAGKGIDTISTGSAMLAW